MSRTSIHAKIQESFRKRLFVFMALVFLIFIVIIIQLINLQIVNSNEYKLKARLNMEDYIPILAPRGEIYDRNFAKDIEKSNVVVSNRASFNITTVRAKFENDDQLEYSIKNLSHNFISIIVV